MSGSLTACKEKKTRKLGLAKAIDKYNTLNLVESYSRGFKILPLFFLAAYTAADNLPDSF
jgi:hypothetical protein